MLSVSGQTELPFAAVQTRFVAMADDQMARKKSPGSSEQRLADGRAAAIRDFSRSLPMTLLRTREAVMRQFRPSLRQHGLTEQQWRILRALASVEAVEVTELARMAFLLGPSLSRILRDLETRGLIERRTAENDLRRARVSISQEGLKLIEIVAPYSEAIYAEITRRYGTSRLKDLQQMLGALEGSLARLEGATPEDGEGEE
jgi:homoprotocatechuate degradation regulator HpaR